MTRVASFGLMRFCRRDIFTAIARVSCRPRRTSDNAQLASALNRIQPALPFLVGWSSLSFRARRKSQSQGASWRKRRNSVIITRKLSDIGLNPRCQATHHLGIGTNIQSRSRPRRMFLRRRLRSSNANRILISRRFAAGLPRKVFPRSRQRLEDVAFLRRLSGVVHLVPPQHPIQGLRIGIDIRPGSRPPSVAVGGFPAISRTHRPSCFHSPILSVHIVRRRRTSRTRSRLSRARSTASATGRILELSRLATNRTRHISNHATKTKQPSPREEKKYKRHSRQGNQERA